MEEAGQDWRCPQCLKQDELKDENDAADPQEEEVGRVKNDKKWIFTVSHHVCLTSFDRIDQGMLDISYVIYRLVPSYLSA